MSATTFHVHLELFGGPLDLLLYLVRRHEVDVCDLPLADIADQFAEFLSTLDFLDFSEVGEFVVTASSLLEIKSRDVLPQTADDDADEDASEGGEPLDGPQSELIRQLVAYKRFKDAAAALDQHATRWLERYPRLSDDRPTSERDASADRIRDVELWDLVSALGRVLRTQQPDRFESIRYDDTPISVYVERVASRVRREGRTAFSSFFEGARDRARIVGTFMAILELLRHHGFRAEQPIECGEIWILEPVPRAG